MLIDEIWSIEYEEANRFFIEKKTEDFSYRLIKLEDKKLGNMSIPRLRLVLEGDSLVLEEIYRQFKMKFLKGGA